MRALVAAVATCTAVLAASPALACIGYPPPHFPSLRADGGPPIFIGEVLSVRPNADLQDNPRFEVKQATAVIAVLEAVQGEMPAEVQYTAATEVRLKPGQPVIDGWCGPYMDLKPGDLILGLKMSWGLQILRPEQVSEDDLIGRIESYR